MTDNLADTKHDAALRPKRFADFTGQKSAINNLQVMVYAAKQRNEPPDHILLTGPPGLGKTTLAGIVATELGGSFVSALGTALTSAADLAGIVSAVPEGGVLFIDEVHRMSPQVQEVLYPALEDFTLTIVSGQGEGARVMTVPLPRFTCIAATTRPGAIAKPLHDRFKASVHLTFYEPEELAQVVVDAAFKLGLRIDDDAAYTLGSCSRGTPRIALNLLRRVRDYAELMERPAIDSEAVETALTALGITDLGLTELDRSVLSTVVRNFDGGPVGLNALCGILCEEPDAVSEAVEPYLMRMGLLARTPRGRIATDAAYSYLQGATT